MTSAISSLLMVVGLWLTLALLCCSGGRSTESGSKKVRYQVDGMTNKASLTYANEDGGTEQREVSVPWSKEFNCRPGEFLYLSAQNRADYGSIVATIFVDGHIEKQSVSSGGYVIATASSRCPIW